MAATELAIQEVTAAAFDPVYSAANVDGHWLAPAGTLPHLLHVVNGGGGAITVTINDPNSVSPVGAAAFNADLSISVPAGQDRIVAVLPRRFEDANTGQIDVAFSGVTSVTVAAFVAPTTE